MGPEDPKSILLRIVDQAEYLQILQSEGTDSTHLYIGDYMPQTVYIVVTMTKVGSERILIHIAPVTVKSESGR